MGGVYYNEIDPFAVGWLRALIKAGAIPDGEVDTRSIESVQPDDVRGFRHCHFFAGIGGWPYALGLAGWPAERTVWTGSCPCQPFSVIGRHAGTDDSRHLWPAFFSLIAAAQPAVLFGEQVASAAGREWLTGIRADLEDCCYAFGAADLCAASVGSPHRRQRLYWVADAGCTGLERLAWDGDDGEESGRIEADKDRSVAASGTALPDAAGLDALPVLRGVDLHDPRPARRRVRVQAYREMESRSVWAGIESLACADGWRRVESGTFPLADGVSGRVGRLRGYGNAIVPQVAQAFIEAYLDTVN